MSKAKDKFYSLVGAAIDDYFDCPELTAYIKELEEQNKTAKDIISHYRIGEKNWKKCPMCDDIGGYMTSYEDVEQCEFCWCEHSSIFNQKRIKDFLNE